MEFLAADLDLLRADGGHADERYASTWLVFPALLPDIPHGDRVPTIALWLEAAPDA